MYGLQLCLGICACACFWRCADISECEFESGNVHAYLEACECVSVSVCECVGGCGCVEIGTGHEKHISFPAKFSNVLTLSDVA